MRMKIQCVLSFIFFVLYGSVSPSHAQMAPGDRGPYYGSWMLVFKDGTTAYVTGYQEDRPYLHVTNQAGSVFTLKVSDLDLEKTMAANKKSPMRFSTTPPRAQTESSNVAAAPPTAKPAPAEPASPAVATPDSILVTIPDGTPIEIETRKAISSAEVEMEQVIDFSVVLPVRVNGFPVIERGAPARARIVEAEKARRLGKGGRIGWVMEDVSAVENSRIPLRFVKQSEGKGTKEEIAVGAAVTAVIFWPVAPLWGLLKGDDLIIHAGKRFTVFVNGDTVLRVPTKQLR